MANYVIDTIDYDYIDFEIKFRVHQTKYVILTILQFLSSVCTKWEDLFETLWKFEHLEVKIYNIHENALEKIEVKRFDQLSAFGGCHLESLSFEAYEQRIITILTSVPEQCVFHYQGHDKLE